MWKHAVSELRLHPGRYIATLIAIAISVGFISAISIFVNSQQNAMERLAALPMSQADLIVRLDDTPVDEAISRLSSVAGVDGVAEMPISMLYYLTHGDRSAQTNLYQVPQEWQHWAQVVEGRLPAKKGEVALSRGAMADLGARVGDTLSAEGEEATFTVVGVTDDPSALFATTGYVSPDAEDLYAWELAVRLAPGASEPTTLAAVKRQAAELGQDISVVTGDEARSESLLSLTDGFDALKNMLQAFAAVALLVGAITIANTFTILAAQRRRQTGLLRAVGASPGQVQGRLMVEALLLGAVGSLVGLGLGALVAWIGGFVTESNYFGLALRPVELLLAWLAGVIATFVAAVVPSLRAARTRPIEALQSVPTAAEARRAGLARAIVCGVTGVVGVGLVVLSRTDSENAIFYAIPAGILLTIAVLGGAPFYVAPLLRLAGKLFGRLGPTTRLAFTNAARNPQRAAATATALMLAVGLIVTLQVALATTRTSGMQAINESYPTDLAVTFEGSVPDGFVETLARTSGVKAAVEVPGKRVDLGEAASYDGHRAAVLSPKAAYAELGIEPRETRVPNDTAAIISASGAIVTENKRLTLPGIDGPLDLEAKTSENVDYDQVIVSEATFAKVAGEAETLEVWIGLTDRTDATVLNQVLRTVEGYPDARISGGGAVMASVFTQFLNVMLIVMTALLGVAVVIALVGVANTLSLSVIERQRESALLRALGMQRASLRSMLLIEAIALVGLGTLIGLAAGSFFGWLGVSSVMGMMPVEFETVFALDGLYTAGLILACLAAAALASVLPGRKAANATPTEALAVD